MRCFINIIFSFSLYAFTLNFAQAGDYANREVIGFSKDGNLFAFEQYGVQDGSGFAYSDIFIINTQNDIWVEGSPYRVLLRDEFSKISDARKQSRELAASALATITDPGVIAATNRPDEDIADPYKISVKPRSFILPDNAAKMTFKVELISLPTPENCKGLVDEGSSHGFRLIRSTPTGDNVVMHEDNSIPASRGCPFDYYPADIVFHYAQDGKYTLAVLIRTENFGFEGRDGRFLAFTAPLN